MATGHKKQAVQAQSNSNPGDVAVSAIMAGQARALPSDVTPKPPSNAIDVDAKTA